MLSEETAQGKYPLECVAVLNRVALRTERAMLSGRPVELQGDVRSQGLADAFSESTSQLAQDIDASVVVIHSGNETMIPKVSRFRSGTIIVHVSEKEALLRRSKIVWGVYQCKAETPGAPDTPLDSSIQTLMREEYLKAGDRAVFVRDVGSSAVHARLTLSAVVVHESSKGTTAG